MEEITFFNRTPFRTEDPPFQYGWFPASACWWVGLPRRSGRVYLTEAMVRFVNKCGEGHFLLRHTAGKPQAIFFCGPTAAPAG